ncbi:hypothetical protein [Micromonospora taraxaci]
MEQPSLEHETFSWQQERRRVAAVAARLVLDTPHLFLTPGVLEAWEWTRVRDAAFILLATYKQQEEEAVVLSAGQIMDLIPEIKDQLPPLRGDEATILDFPIDVVDQRTGKLFPEIVREIRRGFQQPGAIPSRQHLDREIPHLLNWYRRSKGLIAVQYDRLEYLKGSALGRVMDESSSYDVSISAPADEVRLPPRLHRSWLARLMRRVPRETRLARFPSKAQVVKKVDNATHDLDDVLNLLGPPPQSEAGPVTTPPRKPVGVS